MAVERRWSYEGPVSGAEADGETCIFCGERLVDEAQAAHWTIKADEDNPDADYPVEHGYAHWSCSQKKRDEAARSRFRLPDVPDLPRRS